MWVIGLLIGGIINEGIYKVTKRQKVTVNNVADYFELFLNVEQRCLYPMNMAWIYLRIEFKDNLRSLDIIIIEV